MWTVEDMKEFLWDYNIATIDEINLVSKINGFSTETMEDILYAKTGYSDFDDYIESELSDDPIDPLDFVVVMF